MIGLFSLLLELGSEEILEMNLSADDSSSVFEGDGAIVETISEEEELGGSLSGKTKSLEDRCSLVLLHGSIDDRLSNDIRDDLDDLIVGKFLRARELDGLRRTGFDTLVEERLGYEISNIVG